ncbi:hypothetical protein AB1Y20_003929 [Prymnesium parvum]|uniref:Target of rapamycin complex subunit LST8 n=1 Tax=Prymnesium parvum TaxID=97485 RepID=A0AB34J6C0_PRYPA
MPWGLSGHRGAVLCLDSPGGGTLASGSDDGTVRIWDLAAGRAVRALLPPTARPVNAVSLGRPATAASSLAFAAVGAELVGFDLRAPGVLLRHATPLLPASRDDLAHLALSASGRVLAAADDAGDVMLYDVAAAAALPPLRGAHHSVCSSLAFSPCADDLLCSGGMDLRCVQWECRRAAPREEWSLLAQEEAAAAPPLLNPRYVHCVSYAPDGAAIALALGDGSVELRRAVGGDLIGAAAAHRAAASQAHFAPELGGGGGGGVPLITAGDDACLGLWSAEGLAGAAGRGKRRRTGGGEWAGGARGGDGEEGEGGTPLLRHIVTVSTPEKPNWIAAASAAGGSASGVVCVASNAEVILVYTVGESSLT